MVRFNPTGLWQSCYTNTVAVWLHKHWNSWFSTFCNSISNITLTSANQTLWHMSTTHSPFSGQRIASNFSSVPTVFLWFFTWTALGDVDLGFSLILVTKAYAVEQGTTSATWFYHQCNQSIHMADGVTAMSLSASLQDKMGTTRDHPCQIVLNWKLSGTVYVKSC